MRGLTLAVIAAALAGCATEPIPDSETSLIPRDRVLIPAYLDAASNTGVVTVKRDAGFLASGCKLEILVDAQAAVQLKRAELVVLHLPIGDHNLGVRPVCPLPGGGLSETQAHVTAATPLRYRVGVPAGGGVLINPTSF